MKNLLLITMLLVSMLSCAQNLAIKTVTFSSHSRGYLKTVIINADSITVSKGGNRPGQQNSISRVITKNEGKILNDLTSSLNLSLIPSYDSPTNKRAYDGARHSKISIKTKDGIYEHLFDDENPHSDLNKLMHLIKKLQDR